MLIKKFDVRISFWKTYDIQRSGVYAVNLNQGIIIIAKSERSNYRKYIVTKIAKAGNSKTTKWGRYIYVVTYCLEKIVDTPSAAFYFQFRDPPLISNKVPDLEFYWRTDHEFYISLGISNCKSVWSTDKFVRKMMLLCKK